jgi:hypothetical protein
VVFANQNQEILCMSIYFYPDKDSLSLYEAKPCVHGLAIHGQIMKESRKYFKRGLY